MDLQGHGQSAGDRVHIEHFQDYVDDYVQFVHLTLANDPVYRALPKLLLGHSMGGLIAVLTVRATPNVWSGVCLSAPGFRAHPASAKPWEQRFLPLLSPWVPKWAASKIDPAKLSRSPEVVSQFVHDPLNSTQGMRIRWCAEFLQSMDTGIKGASADVFPVLVLQAGADTIVCSTGIDDYLDRMGAAVKVRRIYDGFFHELIHEPGSEQVLADMAFFFDNQLRR